MGIKPPTPSFERSFITALTGDWTIDTSGKVINLNTNTTFKCVPHILGYLQFLQMVAALCANAHYYFAHSFNSPWGSKASSMCPVRCALTPWATRVGQCINLPNKNLTNQNVWKNENVRKMRNNKLWVHFDLSSTDGGKKVISRVLAGCTCLLDNCC